MSDKQLEALIDKYAPQVQAVARAALATLRERLPGAVETVYDNYNALAIAFGPTDSRADVVLSITLYPRWVSLFFAHGADLADPDKLLRGTGTTVRHIVLEDAAVLNRPAVRRLVLQAVKGAKPFDRSAPRRVVIKSVAKTRRPRRPTTRRAAR